MSMIAQIKNKQYYGQFIEADKKTFERHEIELVGFVQMTKNYDLFKFIDGNRNIVPAHLKRLMESMTEEYLITIVIVNENFEILDGQHRFEACKRLGLPVFFIQIKGYGLLQVQRYNDNNRNWTPNEYLNSYLEQGIDEYKVYNDIKKKFGFNHTQILTLMAGGSCDSKDDLKRFKRGEIKMVGDVKSIYRLGQMVYDFRNYYAGYKRRPFFRACMTMFRNKKYDHKTMIAKLSRQTDRLKDCVNEESYLKIMQDIYNHHSREKIRFV